MTEAIIDLDFNRHAQDLRETWQGRLLRTSAPESLGRAVIMSVLAHNFDDAFFVLLKAVFPDLNAIRAPFICSAARINKRGQVVVDMVLRGHPHVTRDCVIAPSLKALESLLRRLADHMKFNDDDRRQLFVAARNWVVADRRLDPAMDPADPDARRLVVH